MKRVHLFIGLALAVALVTPSCQNSEIHSEDRMPGTTEYTPTDSAGMNNKLDTAQHAMERDRDTMRTAVPK